jgi:hypothetical protein
MGVELRQRTFGELIGQCFSLALSHFSQLFVIIGLFGLPNLFTQILLLPILHPEAARGQLTQEQLGLQLLGLMALIFVALILAPIQQAASILLVASSFTGERPTIGSSLRVAARKFFPLLGLSFAVTMILAIGLMLFFVPGIVFLTWFFVAAPAMVVEDLSVREAMGRSRSLSSDWRWSILGYLIVTTLLIAVISGAVNGLLAAAMGHGVGQTVVSYILNVILGIISVVAPVVYYFHLRVVKEAFDVESLSSLVDAIAARAGSKN